MFEVCKAVQIILILLLTTLSENSHLYESYQLG